MNTALFSFGRIDEHLEKNYFSRAFYDKMGWKIFKNTTIEFGNKRYGLVMYKYDIKNIKKNENK